MKKVLVLIVLSFLFVGCSSNINNDVNNVERKMISVNEVENIIKNLGFEKGPTSDDLDQQIQQSKSYT